MFASEAWTKFHPPPLQGLKKNSLVQQKFNPPPKKIITPFPVLNSHSLSFTNTPA